MFSKYDPSITHVQNQVACENSALLKLFLFYVFDIVLAYTIAGSFLSKLQQFMQLIGRFCLGLGWGWGWDGTEDSRCTRCSIPTRI